MPGNADYDWWQSALEGTKQPIIEAEPHSGYWWMRDRFGGRRIPVATYLRGGDQTMIALVGHATQARGLTESAAIDIWPDVAGNPVAYEAYVSAFDLGGRWPDDPPDSVFAGEKPDAPRRRASRRAADTTDADAHDALEELIGDPVEGLIDGREQNTEAVRARAVIDAAIKDAATIVVTDEASRVRAQEMRSHLMALANKAAKRHATAKRPYLDACQAIDEAWTPMVKIAKGTAEVIRDRMDAYATAKRKAADAEQLRLDAERLKASTEELARRAAAEPAATSDGQARPNEPEPEQLPLTNVVPIAPAEPVRIKGSTGRATREVEFFTAIIEDQDATYQAFKLRREVGAVLLKLAQEAVDAGREVPGVRVEKGVTHRG